MVSEIRTNRMASRAGLSTVTLTDTGPIFSGIATFTDTTQFDVNNLNAIGVITATSYTGDGSALTGITQVGGATGVDFNDNVKARFGNTNDLVIFYENGGADRGKIGTVNSRPLDLLTNNTTRIVIENNGHVRPATNNNYDLGTSGDRWRNVYATTMNATTMNATTFVGNGDFVDLDVDGNTNLDNVSIAGVVTASHFYGDGSNLSNIDPTPAGANTQVQYNNNGAFGASSSLTFNGSMLEVAGIVSATSSPSGTEGLRKVYASTSSPSGGADGDLWLKYDTNAASSYLPTGGGTVTGNIVVQNSSLQVTNTSASAGNYLEMKTNADSSVSLDKVGAGAFNIGGNNIYLKEDTSNTYYAGFEYNGKCYLRYANVDKIETTSYGVLVSGEVRDSLGDLRSLPQNNTSGTYTLVAADAGKHVRATGNITIPSGTFSTGDMITIYNNSGSAIDIIEGSSTTVYNSNDASTGNKSLKARGLCTILCESNNAFVASGNFA